MLDEAGTASTLQFPARIGLGTWRMGNARSARAAEVAAVFRALEIGYRLFDTAEMYAEGGAERVIGEALAASGRSSGTARSGLFIVSKVLPGNASYAQVIRACEQSLSRLRCGYLDLYLLHWRGPHPFSDTLRAFEQLRGRGLIRHYGVSNFDESDLAEWLAAERALGLEGRTGCNQLYYCLQQRAIEFGQLRWQRARSIRTMAYSPLGQGSLVEHPLLRELAQARGVTAAQIALAWTVRDADVVAIPKSVHHGRIAENLAAADLQLDATELARLDQAFPPPRMRQPLPMT